MFDRMSSMRHVTDTTTDGQTLLRGCGGCGSDAAGSCNLRANRKDANRDRTTVQNTCAYREASRSCDRRLHNAAMTGFRNGMCHYGHEPGNEFNVPFDA